jgi:meiotic recombination protein DMC1
VNEPFRFVIRCNKESYAFVDGPLSNWMLLLDNSPLRLYASKHRLKDAGFFTVSSVLMHTQKTLSQVKGLSEQKIVKIREAALKLVGAGFITGNEARTRRSQIIHISTGSPALDEILGGGIETASITEAFGEFRCGKTQLSHTMCVTAQMPRDSGGGNGRVAFIDTENTFRPERIVEIAQRFELDPDDVLDNILVARAYTSEHQIELLDHVAARMASDRFALLIVDSATALFRVDFSGRGELADRQQKLNRFMSSLAKISEQFSVAVWITNQGKNHAYEQVASAKSRLHSKGSLISSNFPCDSA